MFDPESLLAPLDGESPVGPDLRLVAGDTTLSAIEELRREEDPAVDPDGRGKDADWPAAAAACEKALRERSKDLQLAAWFTESLTRTEGFEGMLAGLRLVGGLLDRYWDSLHPGVDPDDGEIIHALRARWISWLGQSREFLAAVRSVPITQGPGIEERGWGDYENSQRVDDAAILADTTQHDELIATGMIGGAKWRSLLGGTDPERLRAMVGTLRECETEVRNLEAFCDERFPEDNPNLMDLINLLDACRSHIDDYLAGSLPPPGEDSGSDAGGAVLAGASGGGGGGAGAGGRSGPIGSRDEAYRRLREVSEYLRRTEPHSPVAALLERAVHWGNLSFQELVLDVLKHQEDAREQIFETLGIQIPGDEE